MDLSPGNTAASPLKRVFAIGCQWLHGRSAGRLLAAVSTTKRACWPRWLCSMTPRSKNMACPRAMIVAIGTRTLIGRNQGDGRGEALNGASSAYAQAVVPVFTT